MKRTDLITRYPVRGLALALAILLVGLPAAAGAQGPVPQGDVSAQGTVLGTAFTYQGRLFLDGDNPAPAEGDFELEFTLYDTESNGSPIADPVTVDVHPDNGVFAVTLDFGPNAFTGEKRWLQIGVRKPGEILFTYLTGRQELTPTPYALTANYALTADHALMAEALPGLRTQTVDSAGNPLESPNVIGGFVGNTVTEGVVGATIHGGGRGPDPQAPRHNKVTDDYGTVGGGEDNQAGSTGGTTKDARHATAGGGFNNYAMAEGATIAGGLANVIREDAKYAAIGGGSTNRASGEYATVGGGRVNRAVEEGATVGGGYDNVSDSPFSTVGGGVFNAAHGRVSTVGGGGGNEAREYWSTVGGGSDNIASGGAATVGGGVDNIASGVSATVGGGTENTASGYRATIPGGSLNVAAGNSSFAAGLRAKIGPDHHGAFLFADANEHDFASRRANEFAVRATGGVRFVSAIDSDTGDPTAGVVLWPGGSSWAPMSDRNAKDNIIPADGRDVLHKLADMPITTWNYKSQDPTIRHIGPMAQDFYTAFDVGEDDVHISTVDADGVALAAIQGLYQVVQDQETQIKSLAQKNADLEARIADLESTMAREAAPVSGFSLANWPVLGGLLVSAGAVWWGRRRGNR